MTTFEELRRAFTPVQMDFLHSGGLQMVQQGKIGVGHYASYLRQVFHHTRENPQIQALATVYFRGHQRAAIKRFFKHASSEIGHDQLALEDLRKLGTDVSTLPYENPLPETAALLAFPFYQIHNLNPVGYLGYLFFLEFLPTGNGGALMDALERGGVPRSAMRFLHDHATIDVAHNRMMESYAEILITNQREFDSVVYAMRVTGVLYANMVQAAFAAAESGVDYGFSAAEAGSLSHDLLEERAREKTGERRRVRWDEDASAVVKTGKHVA